MTRRRMLWITAVALLVGCAPAGTGPVGPGAGGVEGYDRDRAREQARAALARYDKAVLDTGSPPRFVPVGELTGLVGNWEPANENNKEALASGRIVARGVLPAPPQRTGTVVWENGASRTLPLISADEALRQLAAAGAGNCPECLPLTVLDARMTNVRIETTRGKAEVPAWEYALDGTAVRVTRVAVAGSAIVTVTAPSWDPYNPPVGLAIESAATSIAGKGLTVTFTGAPGPGSRPCGADYSAEAVESVNAVVVIVIEHRLAADEACTAIGAPRTAIVELAGPLGERAVLDGLQGLPVPLTITR